jgi:hypothetical protein
MFREETAEELGFVVIKYVSRRLIEEDCEDQRPSRTPGVYKRP